MKDYNKEFGMSPESGMEAMSLEELARIGAKMMLEMALKAEINVFLNSENFELKDGKLALVRNGYHQEREIMTSGGPVRLRVPRARDRSGEGKNFVSKIIPPYLRRSLKIDNAIPLLYLYGISTKDMMPALWSLLGEGAKGISASTVSRLKSEWEKEQEEWSRRDLSDKEYCYIWVDGIYFNVRNSNDRMCLMVMIGVNSKGEKELIAIESGYRESSESWKSLLRDLRDRGLKCPKLFIGDGNMGFWNAQTEIFPHAKKQRCWIHRKRNILDKLPKSVQPEAKRCLDEIEQAPDRKTALKEVDKFHDRFDAKYPKAVDCLMDDLDSLLRFFDFPAKHWIHIKTTNVIESTFSTVRLRTKKTRNCGSRKTIHAMVFKLIQSASKRWRRLRGYGLVELVMKGVKFVDGVREEQAA